MRHKSNAPSKSKNYSTVKCKSNHFVPTAGLVQKLGEVCKSAVGAELVVHVKGKAEDGGSHMEEMLSTLKGSAPEPLVGVLSKVPSICLAREARKGTHWEGRGEGEGGHYMTQ